MRLLMDEPNVLLLDEPTNDLDIDTLTALEDLLDGWPGTLVVVSHDRYFVERVCDDVYALTGDGAIRHLPGGIEQYVEQRRAAAAARRRRAAARPRAAATPGAALRAARKEVQRLERELDKLEAARGDAARADGGERDRPRAPARAAGRARPRCSSERERLEAAVARRPRSCCEGRLGGEPQQRLAAERRLEVDRELRPREQVALAVLGAEALAASAPGARARCPRRRPARAARPRAPAPRR